ncbi:MAG TPA: hypothetical protein VLR44_10400 [Rhodoferax sp.]|nr:hypothetical protein [Rhodoferax sp.]
MSAFKMECCPPSPWNGVRDDAGMLSAISMESCPPWRGIRTKTLARIQNGFIKMGSKAPQKVKPFLRHVGALLGKDSTAEQVDAMVAKLEAAGVVWFIGDEVVYGRK